MFEQELNCVGNMEHISWLTVSHAHCSQNAMLLSKTSDGCSTVMLQADGMVISEWGKEV